MILEYVPDSVEALAKQYPDLTLCRVSLQQKGRYKVFERCGEHFAAVSGKFQYEAKKASEYPAVGDYVMADLSDKQNAVIHYVLPRKSMFIRKAAGKSNSEQIVAANIDTVFICMSLNNDFNLRRIERYVSASWESGAVPVIVLTKSDLCDDTNAKIADVKGVAIGIDVLCLSCEEDKYMSIMPYIKAGKTVAFVGSSGVGKSTLINKLLGENILETNGLRNDDKGRHTTTQRELMILKNGAMVIDTPGMRELGMWDASEGLKTTFSDIEILEGKCRFKNCTHETEPGCSVSAALKDGSLSMERWKSYKKLMQENAYAEDMQGYLNVKEKKFKNIAKFNKNNKKK